MGYDYVVSGSTLKTKSELQWKWQNPPAVPHQKEALVECKILIRNPYSNPGKLCNFEYSFEENGERYTGTVLPDRGVGVSPIELTPEFKEISIFWFAGYDIRMMQDFNEVWLHVNFCEESSGIEAEPLSVRTNVDLRPTAHFDAYEPKENDKYFNIRFLTRETAMPGLMQFTVEIDTEDTFDSPNYQVLKTEESPNLWKMDGLAFPEQGVLSDEEHIVEFSGELLKSLQEGRYYYRITDFFYQFYPVVDYPPQGYVTMAEVIDIEGHIVIVD